MAEDLKKQLGDLWSGFRKKTADAVANQEAAFARGKVAGKTVTDDSGYVIVEAGQTIDDVVIETASALGKLHALAASAVAAKAQDYREKAQDAYEASPEGKEARSLDSVEQVAEARRYKGHVAGVDVTDIRGNVVVPAGEIIDENHLDAARAAGLLGSLIYSAQQACPPDILAAAAERRERAARREYAPRRILLNPDSQVEPPRKLPLVDLPDDGSTRTE